MYAVVSRAQDCVEARRMHRLGPATQPRQALLQLCTPAQVDIKDTLGRTALHRACGEASVHCTAARAHCRQGCTAAMASLLRSGKCDINAKARVMALSSHRHATQDNRLATPLLWATVTNRPEMLVELLARGAKPLLCDVTGKTALQYALEKNHAECAKLLKAHSSVSRCVPRSNGEESLSAAARSAAGPPRSQTQCKAPRRASRTRV